MIDILEVPVPSLTPPASQQQEPNPRMPENRRQAEKAGSCWLVHVQNCVCATQAATHSQASQRLRYRCTACMFKGFMIRVGDSGLRV